MTVNDNNELANPRISIHIQDAIKYDIEINSDSLRLLRHNNENVRSMLSAIGISTTDASSIVHSITNIEPEEVELPFPDTPHVLHTTPSSEVPATQRKSFETTGTRSHSISLADMVQNKSPFAAEEASKPTLKRVRHWWCLCGSSQSMNDN